MQQKLSGESYKGLDCMWPRNSPLYASALKANLTGQTMDATDLKFSDGQFNVIMDKGTLDTLLCGDNSTANAAKYCAEASRVLQSDGVLFIVSYGTPENRMSYLEQEEYGWSVNVHTIAKPTVSAAATADSSDASSVHYIYVCQKR